MADLPKGYEPAEIEPRWYAEWMARGYFHADAAAPKAPFAIVIPPPNVTGALHMGHALGNDDRGHLHPLAPDGRLQRHVAAGLGPRRHRDPDGGGARAARHRQQEPARPRPRGLRGARLGLAPAHRRQDLRAAQAARLLARLGARHLHDGSALLGGGDRGVRSPLRGGAHLPGAAPHQLVPQRPDGALGPGGRLRRGDPGGAVRVRLSAGRRLGRGGGGDDAPRDDAGRHGDRRPPRRSAPPIKDRQDGPPPVREPGVPDHRRRDPGRSQVRHRRREGDAGARSERLRDRAAAQPAR